MKDVLDKLKAGTDLHPDQAASLALAICEGRLPDADVGALLTALAAKGESTDEIGAFARVLRDWARRPALPAPRGPLVDIVGTGGDGSGSLNISTAAAIIAAGAGLSIAKHGNRAVSGRCGAADVLAALGMNTSMDDAQLAESLRRARFAFLFAPNYHPALAALAPVRRALGIRTIFNLLGPLLNPARPTHAVIGACSPRIGRSLAEVARLLGMQRCFVVSSTNGWDEATTACPFLIIESRADTTELRESLRSAADYGLAASDPSTLQGGDATLNAQAIRDLLSGRPSAFRDAAAITAALALEVTGTRASPIEALRAACESIDHGHAARVLAAITTHRATQGSTP